MYRETLQRYMNYLLLLAKLKGEGRATVTSDELACREGVTGSRVRQDLAALRVLGKPRQGYRISDLEILISSMLDILSAKPMALVGIGNLGRALALSDIWNHAGFELVALFDSDKDLVGAQVGSLAVRDAAGMAEIVLAQDIQACCLAVPADQAQAVADQLVAVGVRALWNFALVDLDVPDGIIVENQRLEQGLMTLSFLIAKRGADKLKAEEASS